MTTKNYIRRFATCKRFERAEGFNHFEWINGALYDRLMSIVVALMTKNQYQTLDNEIDKL